MIASNAWRCQPLSTPQSCPFPCSATLPVRVPAVLLYCCAAVIHGALTKSEANASCRRKSSLDCLFCPAHCTPRFHGMRRSVCALQSCNAAWSGVLPCAAYVHVKTHAAGISRLSYSICELRVKEARLLHCRSPNACSTPSIAR